MSNTPVPEDRRTLVDHYLTEIGLYAKELCPNAKVEMLTTSYEGEDGHVRLLVSSGLADSEIEQLESKLADKSTDILLTTGLSILVPCNSETGRAVLVRSNRHERLSITELAGKVVEVQTDYRVAESFVLHGTSGSLEIR